MSPLLLAAVVLLLALYLYRLAYDRPPNFPPGPPRLPIWGSYWLLLWNNYKFLHKSLLAMAHRYKSKIMGFYLGPYPCVIAIDHDTIREILTRPEFQGRPDIIVGRARSLGQRYGIIFTDGPEWTEQRRFFLRHMRDFGFGRRFETTEAAMQEEMQDLVALLQGEWKDEVAVKDNCVMFSRLFAPFSLNAFWSMFGGERYERHEHNQLRVVSSAGVKFMQVTDSSGGAVSLTEWLRFTTPNEFGLKQVKNCNQHILNFVKKSIIEHKATHSEEHMKDFLDLYIKKLKSHEEGEKSTVFTEDQALLVGTDMMTATSTALPGTMTFLFHCLMDEPEVQCRIQQEIDAVVGRDRLPTLDDRKMMPYLEATLREGMRRITALPLSIPHVTTEDTFLKGYSIPKNTLIFTHLWNMHMDPDVWEKPEQFRPERFLEPDGQLKKKDITLPFGAGKRLCVGETFSRQMMFLFTSSLLQNFSFKPAGEKSPLPRDTVINGFNLTAPDIWARIIPRS